MPEPTQFSLPPAPGAGRRVSPPVLACVVPVLGAGAMWLATGSPLVLWFAALGPLTATASVLDAVRSGRRERRRERAARADTVTQVRARITSAHDEERAALRARHPDAAGFASAPGEVWRTVPGRAGMLVVGRGPVASAVRVHGEGVEAAAVRDEAGTVTGAPVV
ncbi:MAG: cell division protein FtsK, partial [Microbacterium sp.]